MKVLFDQNTPRPLARFLVDHRVIRAAELGWSELRNGDLLRAAEQDGFDVLVTADRNLAYQQNLKDRKLGIVILPSGQWPEVEPHVMAVVAAVGRSQPGGFVDLTALRTGDKGRAGNE